MRVWRKEGEIGGRDNGTKETWKEGVKERGEGGRKESSKERKEGRNQ